MAKLIEAVQARRPRVQKGKAAGLKEVVNIIIGRTSQNHGATYQALMEFMYVLSLLLNSARPVVLPGLGTFTPSISLDGRVKVNLRVDKGLLSALNADDALIKEHIINKTMIGKTTGDLVALWNEEHPEDPVEIAV